MSQIMSSIRSMYFSLKELSINFSIVYGWGGPPDSCPPCIVGSFGALPTPLVNLVVRHLLRDTCDVTLVTLVDMHTHLSKRCSCFVM